VPWTEVGERRLTAELRAVEECLVQPAAVWWYDPDTAAVTRGTLYGYAGVNGTRRGLLVTRTYVGRQLEEDVRWVRADLITCRRE
jgi:hypothetical protein